MVNNSLTGAAYLFRGLKLLGKPGIRLYVIIPLCINVTIFTVLIYFGVNYFESLTDEYMPQLPAWLQWLYWPLLVLFTLASLVIAFYSFSLLANLIGAPFNGLLSEAVERHLTGAAPPQSGIKQMLVDFVPDMVNEVRKLVFFVLWAIPFLVLFLVPLVQLAAPVLWIFFSSWMLAMQYIDYPMANYKLRLKSVRQAMAQQRFMSLGFGGMTMFATMVPIGNFIVMPAAVAGATAFWVDHIKENTSVEPHS